MDVKLPDPDGIDDRLIEQGFDVRPELPPDQVDAFGDHQACRTNGRDAGSRKPDTATMEAIGTVGRGDQHAGLDDQHDQSHPNPIAHSSSS